MLLRLLHWKGKPQSSTCNAINSSYSTIFTFTSSTYEGLTKEMHCRYPTVSKKTHVQLHNSSLFLPSNKKGFPEGKKKRTRPKISVFRSKFKGLEKGQQCRQPETAHDKELPLAP